VNNKHYLRIVHLTQLTGMKPPGYSRLTVPVALLLVFFLSPATPASGQDLGKTALTSQANPSGTPMVGIEYGVTDRVRLRVSLGYFQFDEQYNPCSFDRVRFCYAAGYQARTRQYSGAIAGLFRPRTETFVEPYAGLELQYLRARSPQRMEWMGSELIETGTVGGRLAGSALAGLSVRPLSWLSIFGEVGLGYVRGVAVRAFRADIESTTRRWGITHASPGIRVSF
jgi:opacity protein-like surface antigen